MGVLGGTAAAFPGVWPVAESTVRLRDLARVEKDSSTRIFFAFFDPSTGLQPLHSATWFSLSPRRPWDVRQGRVDLELHSVSCASPRTFPRQWSLLSRRGGFGKIITMRNFNSSTRTTKFFTLEEALFRNRPAQGASASCLPQSSRLRVDRGMVRLRALPAHSAFAVSWFPVARLARGRLLLVASENNRWTTFLFIIQRSGREKNGAAGGRPRSLATVAAARSWPVARDRSPA